MMVLHQDSLSNLFGWMKGLNSDGVTVGVHDGVTPLLSLFRDGLPT